MDAEELGSELSSDLEPEELGWDEVELGDAKLTPDKNE